VIVEVSFGGRHAPIFFTSHGIDHSLRRLRFSLDPVPVIPIKGICTGLR